ncbi:MAG TPA: hypothetical protein VIT23_11915, partial [Terrimicrobiaceae bacterium]
MRALQDRLVNSEGDGARRSFRPGVRGIDPKRRPLLSSSSTSTSATAIAISRREVPEKGFMKTPERLEMSMLRRTGISQCH